MATIGTQISVPDSNRRWPSRQMTDEQRLANCNLDWWTSDPKVIRSQSSGKEPTLTEAIEVSTAELRDPEKRWQRQNYNSTLRKRRDGLLKKMHQFAMLSNQTTYTPVFFGVQLFGRWHIYSSEEGRSDDWFPSKEFLSKTIPTPRIHTPVKDEAARLQALVVSEEKRQAKLAAQARREEALQEQPTNPASIQNLLNALAEEKAELAKAKFQLRRGQLASAIGAVHRQERSAASAQYVAEVLAARRAKVAPESTAGSGSGSDHAGNNRADSSRPHSGATIGTVDTSADATSVENSSSVNPAEPPTDRSHCSKRKSLLVVEIPVTDKRSDDYQFLPGQNLDCMELAESELDCNTAHDSRVAADPVLNARRVNLDEEDKWERSGGQGKLQHEQTYPEMPPSHSCLASPRGPRTHRRRSARPTLRKSQRLRGDYQLSRTLL